MNNGQLITNRTMDDYRNSPTIKQILCCLIPCSQMSFRYKTRMREGELIKLPHIFHCYLSFTFFLSLSPLGVAARLSQLAIGSFYLFKMLFSVCSLYLARDLSTLELFSASDVEDLAAPTLPFLRFLRVFFFFHFICF